MQGVAFRRSGIAGPGVTGVMCRAARRWVEHGAVIIGGGPVARRAGPSAAPLPAVRAAVRRLRRRPGAARPRRILPLVGTLDDIEKIITGDRLRRRHRRRPLLRGAASSRSPGRPPCGDLWVVPRLREFPSDGGVPDHVGAIPVVRVHRTTLDRSGASSSAPSTCSSPPWLILAEPRAAARRDRDVRRGRPRHLLPPAAGRPRRQAVRGAQVPLDAAGRTSRSRRRSGRWPTTPGSGRSAGSSGAPRSTSCPSCGTSCAVT